MPITLPVPGGGGATPQQTYYSTTPQFGEYQFVSLNEIINNFIATYIGPGKILQAVMRGDVHFHAHRALQELHYDTLKSCKALEIEVCANLRVPLPHDYVNYTKITTVDSNGIEHVLYPTRHTSNPMTIEQDMDECTDCGDGSDSYTFGDPADCNADAPGSTTWTSFSGSGGGGSVSASGSSSAATDDNNFFTNSGERYGLQPEHAQANGSFFIDCKTGMIYFSSNIAGQKIIIHYLSDGHGTTDEAMVPKLAEEAMYKWIAYGCAQARTDVDPNTIARLKQERFAETRKAKIRISNIKIEEISQIMRNKSKWIKH